MKVSLEKDYRKYYTLEDLDRAKEVIKSVQEDTCKVSEYAEMAARVALEYIGKPFCFERIIESSAVTARNTGIWDEYGTSGNFDVWVDGLAEYAGGYIKFGAYLSDIYGTGAVEYGAKMFIRDFVARR